LFPLAARGGRRGAFEVGVVARPAITGQLHPRLLFPLAARGRAFRRLSAGGETIVAAAG
jgi:hypothetical protein